MHSTCERDENATGKQTQRKIPGQQTCFCRCSRNVASPRFIFLVVTFSKSLSFRIRCRPSSIHFMSSSNFCLCLERDQNQSTILEKWQNSTVICLANALNVRARWKCHRKTNTEKNTGSTNMPLSLRQKRCFTAFFYFLWWLSQSHSRSESVAGRVPSILCRPPTFACVWNEIKNKVQFWKNDKIVR